MASWLWFLRALAGVWLADVHSGAAIGWAMVGGVVGYALLARLLPSRQYLHDLLCGTRLETWTPPTSQRPSGAVGQNRAG